MTLRRRIGPLRLHVAGLELAAGPTRRWLESQLLDLPDAGDDGPVLELRFVADLPAPPGGVIVDPIGHAPSGIAVTDLAGRSAHLPLPDPFAGPVLVDGRMNRYQVEEWVLLPMLRLALERVGAALVRCAGVEIDGRVVAIAAPMRTGKTRLLLALLARGARHLGDDWLALDRDGLAHPVLSGVMLRDVHRGQVGGRWPGPTGRSRRWLVRLAGRLARLTAARLPAVSVAFDRLAGVGWVLGFHSVPLSALPEARLGRPAPIGVLVFLSPPSMPQVEAADVPGIVARLGDLDAHQIHAIEAGFAALHPGSAPGPLYLPAARVATALDAAARTATTEVVPVAHDPWVDEATDRVLRSLSEAPGSGV